MDIGRETDTQRLALLRLSAGWLAVVAFLSAAPFAPVWTRWVRSFLATVLGRAEAAAQCLVIVQARLIAGDRDIAVDRAMLFELLSANDADEPPSLAELRRRLVALRCLLRNLPRRALRLLRRLDAIRDAEGESGLGALDGVPRLEGRLAASQCCPPTPHGKEARLTGVSELRND